MTNGGKVETTGGGTLGGGNAITLGNAAEVIFGGLATGNAAFVAGGGTLTANAGLTGDVDLNNGGIVNVAGAALTGNITSGLAVGAASVTVNDVNGIVGTVDLTNGGTVTTTGGVTRGITMGNAANVSVATDIGGIVTGDGTLTLTGVGNVTGTVGTNLLKVTKIIAQADRTFKHADLFLTELAIEGQTKITLAAADLGATNVTTTEDDRSQNIVINVNQTIAGNIGTADNQLGYVVAETAGKTINIKTLEFNAGVKTKAPDTTTVNFTLANAKALSLGDAANQLLKVQFTENGSVSDGVYAAEVNVVAGKTATLGGTIQSKDFSLADAGSKVIFTDNAKIDSAIKATVAGEGLVEFAGNAIITKELGASGKALNTVTFAGDDSKVVKLGADVFATNTIMNKSTIELTKDVEIKGATATNATTINLVDHALKLENATINGSNTIKFNVSDKGDDLAGGNIVISGNLTYANGAALVIDTKSGKVSRPTGGATREFTLIKNDGTLVGKGLDESMITFSSHEKSLITWTKSIDDKGRIKLIIEDNAAKKLKEALVSKDSTNNANIDALTKAAQGTDGHKFVGLLEEFLNADQNDNINEAMERLTSQTTVTATLEDSVSSVGQSLGERAMSLAGNQGSPVETRVVGSENISGVSAGEAQTRFGAWFSPFFNKTTQKARKGAAGYKSEAYGASFGFDTRANDDMIIGAAITASNSELKHKDFKSGDKTKINSLLFSIYGMQQITDSWFALASATFGTNEVKKNSKRKALNGYEVANGKYSSMTFSGDVMFGYNYVTEQATLTPMAGFRYSRVNDGGHKESGTSFQNLDVTNKASNKFEVVAGLRASGGTFDLNGLTVTPEVHGFINYDLINKASKSSVKLGSTDLTTKSSKPARASYNLGLGANAEYGMMEYGASYDAQLANKRVGHQGTLRVRVNF